MSCKSDNPHATVPTLSIKTKIGHGEMYRTKAFPFVQKGTVYGFALSEPLVKPAIPPNESSILTLLALPSGITYGLTGGERGHLFYFHPAFGVTHLGTVGEGQVKGGALVQLDSDEILGGWWGPEGGGLFRHHTTIEAGQGLEQLHGEVTSVEFIPVPVEGEGISTLLYENETRTAYGLTQPGRFLFALDLSSNESQVLARIEEAADTMVALKDGSLLGSFSEGRLWNFSLTETQPHPLDVWVPCQRGKRHVSGVASLVTTRGGLVYGGTSTDGYLFTYDHSTGTLVNLGKPNRQSNIRCLTEGHDGLIYGIVEEARGMAHFFTFDPETRGFEDLGIVGTAFPEYWQAHSIGTMSVGPFGEIVLGETDRLSHLFIYYPPIPK